MSDKKKFKARSIPAKTLRKVRTKQFKVSKPQMAKLIGVNENTYKNMEENLLTDKGHKRKSGSYYDILKGVNSALEAIEGAPFTIDSLFPELPKSLRDDL